MVIGAFGGCALFAAPACATVATTPPTTMSPTQSSHIVVNGLRPYFIPFALLLGASVVVEEIGRTTKKRRRKATRTRRSPARPRRANQPRASSKRRSSRSPAAATPVRPRARTRQQTAAIALPSVPETDGHMWGRRPGQQVAARIAELDAERAKWVRGEHGEIMVAEELAELHPHQWWVFHAVPRGTAGTDIDHLVMGVGGVYTINTKNVSANVWVAERVLMVGGTRTAYLPAAIHEAADVARRLSAGGAPDVAVRPLLAFTQPITVKAMPPDVTVLSAGSVRSWLESQPQVLTAQHAYAVALIADQPKTWA